MSLTHSIYAVYFADHRIKIGVTANVAQRMAYYAQEARRNRVDLLTWWSCAPLEKAGALFIETYFCRQMRGCEMPKHREWFVGDSEAFGSVVSALERLRGSAALPDEDIGELPFHGRSGQIYCGAQA